MQAVFPITVRHSDLDFYRHVSSSRYVDYVHTALWMAGSQAEPPQVARLVMDFRRPLGAVPGVKVRLSPTESASRTDFEVLNEAGTTAHAKGWVDSDFAALPPLLEAGYHSLHRNPLQYEWTIDVRHNDLSPANQLELSQYLEFVLSARWQFLRKAGRRDGAIFEQRGMGFFVAKVDMRFHRPVKGITTVKVNSWISEFRRDRTEIILPFRITSEDGSQVHADGVFDFSVIDFSGGRAKRVPAPEWGDEFFYE